MSEEEINVSLRQMVQNKWANVKTKNGDDYYSLTKQGELQARKTVMKNDETQLEFFCIFYRLIASSPKSKGKSQHEILTETINFMLTEFNPNFLELLITAVKDGKIDGLKLKGDSMCEGGQEKMKKDSS